MKENNIDSKLIAKIIAFGDLLDSVKASSKIAEKTQKAMADSYEKLNFSEIIEEGNNFKLTEKDDCFDNVIESARELRKDLAKAYGMQMATLNKWGQDKLKLEIKKACYNQKTKDSEANQNA